MKKLPVIAVLVVTLSGCGGGDRSEPSAPPGTSTKQASPPLGGAARAEKEVQQLGGPYTCVQHGGPLSEGGITGWLYVCHNRKQHEVDVILGSDGGLLNIHNVPD
jgi:hypothetical protein